MGYWMASFLLIHRELPDDWCVWNMSLGHEKPIKIIKAQGLSGKTIKNVYRQNILQLGQTRYPVSSSWVISSFISKCSTHPYETFTCKKTVPFRWPKMWMESIILDGTGNETISFTPDVVTSSQAFVTGFTRYPVQSDMVRDEHVVVSKMKEPY